MIPWSHQHRPGPLRFPDNALVPGGLPGRSPECTRSCQGCPVLITCLEKKQTNAAMFSEVKRIETTRIFTKPFFVKQKGHIYHDYIMHISHRIHVWYITHIWLMLMGNVSQLYHTWWDIGKKLRFLFVGGFWENSAARFHIWFHYFCRDLSWCFSYPGPTVLVDLDSKV